MALSATAHSEVVKDIQERLRFREENVFRMSFGENPAYIVRPTDNKNGELLHILNRIQGESAIVYVRSRRKTKETTELLVNEGNHGRLLSCGTG